MLLNGSRRFTPLRFVRFNSGQTRAKKSHKLLYTTGAISLGLVGLYYTNDTFNLGVQFTGHAIQRTSTVLNAFVRCAYNYYSILHTEFPTEEAYEKALLDCHSRSAKIARKAIERNAGLFIKIGQHISALNYIFPDEWTQEMIPLQDRCPVSSFESVNEMFKEDLGVSISDKFSYFAQEPLGTASLAQVHKATLKDGKEVAVKLQHPSLRRFVPLDIMLLEYVFHGIDFVFPEYPLLWLSDEIKSSVDHELDFREEARNARLTSEYFSPFYSLTALRVPEVYWAYQRILCMEFVSGARPDDLKYLDDNNIDRNELSHCFAHIFNNMIFTPGIGLHCDPHGGNIAIRKLSPAEQYNKHANHDFEVVLYDHGLYRYVPTEVRRTYSHLWLALLASNDEKIKYYIKELTGIDNKQVELFAAAITGRDPDNATNNVVSKRNRQEIEHMSKRIQEGQMLGDIMQMLKKVPPVVLLILKTNDLTRYLDDRLNAPLGVEGSFLILAKYCARTVYYEGLDKIRAKFGSSWAPPRMWAEVKNLWSYYKVSGQLALYNFYLWFWPSFA